MLDRRIAELTRKLEREVKASTKARRLMTMPGVGLQTAMSVVNAATRFGVPEGSWLARMLARKPKMLAYKMPTQTGQCPLPGRFRERCFWVDL